MIVRACIRRGAVAAALYGSVVSFAAAQPPGSSGPPNALQGFQQNRGQPVQIEASRLEVRDKDKRATFTGRVKVVQGDTTMRCQKLVVYYEPKPQTGAAPAMPAAKPGPGGGSQQISKLEALGGVTVTQKDQTATGNNGLFDMKTNTVTLTGNVLVSQGPNVLRGEKLVVDLTTGVSHVEAGNNGMVRMLVDQSAKDQGGPKFGPQRPASSKPSR